MSKAPFTATSLGETFDNEIHGRQPPLPQNHPVKPKPLHPGGNRPKFPTHAPRRCRGSKRVRRRPVSQRDSAHQDASAATELRPMHVEETWTPLSRPDLDAHNPSTDA